MPALANARCVGRRLTGNRFIDALPPAAANEIARHADLTVIPAPARLAAYGERVREVLFPLSGSVAQCVEHDDGRLAEVYSVAREGIVGHEVLLGEPRAMFARTTAVPLSAFAIGTRALLGIADEHPALRTLAARYAVVATRLAGIGAACERHHHVEARLARWLLELYDHAGSAELAVTHERAATALGVRRAGVTGAYAEIVQAGAIRLDRGRLTVVAPAILERLACGCYAEGRETVERLYRPA